MLQRNKKKVETIDRDKLFSRIQKKAHSLYEKRGYTHANDWSDWFEAEKQVKRELGIR